MCTKICKIVNIMGKVIFKTVSELQRESTQIVTDIEKSGKQVVITKNGKPVLVMRRIKEGEFRIEGEG